MELRLRSEPLPAPRREEEEEEEEEGGDEERAAPGVPLDAGRQPGAARSVVSQLKLFIFPAKGYSNYYPSSFLHLTCSMQVLLWSELYKKT
ncbi:hypothetical protein TURU_064237 [Turdus rufiventris]|nr:hypothetical protein TURU_064237 [Turdus rufiventris]